VKGDSAAKFAARPNPAKRAAPETGRGPNPTCDRRDYLVSCNGTNVAAAGGATITVWAGGAATTVACGTGATAPGTTTTCGGGAATCADR